MEYNDVCLICLRTDRKLKTAPALLSKYHNEMTNHYIGIKKCNYCCICEHLLRKAYKFHQKCLTAAKILKRWENSMTSNKPPLDQLHLKLFPETLGLWTDNNNKVYLFDSSDEDSLAVKEINATNSFSAPVKTMKLEIPPEVTPAVDIRKEVESALEITNITNVDPQDAFDNIVITEIKYTPDTIEVVNADIENSQNALKTDTYSNLNTPRSKLKRNIKIEESDVEDETMYLSYDDSNDDCNDDTIDEIEELDDTILNNDHDYIGNNHTSDDDSEDNNDTMIQADKTEPKVLKLMSTLTNLNETLEDICQNCYIPALRHMVEDITTKEVRKITREYLANKMISTSKVKKKNIRLKIEAMDADLNSIISESKVQVRDSNADSSRKEWSVTTVAKKMRAWGELNTEKGKTFDTESIVSCLDKLSQKKIKQLYQYFSDTNNSRLLPLDIRRTLINTEAKLKDEEYSSVFDIQYLTTEKAKIEEFQQRKYYECYLKADHRCDECFITFSNSGLLEYHLRTNHDEINTKYVCSICNVRRTSKFLLMRHMNLHDEVFKCKLCPLVTYYRKSVEQHYLRHKGKSQYNCEKCNKTFGSVSVLLTHNSQHHPRGAHICTVCGGSYVSHTGLKIHLQRKHPGATEDAMSTKLKCETCNITFASLEEYSKHSRNHHRRRFEIKKKLMCEYCDLSFLTNKECNKHLISAHGLKEKDIKLNKPIVRCRVCGEVGHSSGWVMLHYSTHHPTVDVTALYAGDKTHLCEICGKGYANNVYLLDHMNSHKGITFPCPRCPKRFGSKAALKRHALIHDPPGFACKNCGKKFKSRPNLARHMRSHIGDRRYKCDICGKGFLQMYTLTAHIRGVHENEHRIRKRKRATHRATEKKNIAETVNEVTEATDEVRETIDEVVESTDDEIEEPMDEMEIIHEETEMINYEVLETDTEMIDEILETNHGTDTREVSYTEVEAEL